MALHRQVQNLRRHFREFTISHVYRSASGSLNAKLLTWVLLRCGFLLLLPAQRLPVFCSESSTPSLMRCRMRPSIQEAGMA